MEENTISWLNYWTNLFDMVRDNENHPLANLIDVVGVLIETYENEHVPAPTSDPVSVLKHFMEEYT